MLNTPVPVQKPIQTYKESESGRHYLFEIIVAYYQSRIYRYIQNLVQDTEVSADITQDTFLAIYVILGSNQSKPEGSFNTAQYIKGIQPLIYTIARNKALDELRKKKRIRFISLTPPSTSYGESRSWQEEFEATIEYRISGRVNNLETQVIMEEELKSAIETVGRHKWLNLFLYLNGYSYKEIGQITGDSMSSVKSKIFRCKQNMRQVLIENPD